MESAKPTHTPGPWTYGPKNEDGHRFIFGPDETPDHNESGEPVIAELWDALDPISEADARLIAAAPELLAALRGAVDLLSCNCGSKCDGTCTYSEAVAAILKAGGR